MNTQNFWTFELGTQDGTNVPIWIIIGFQQRERQDSQNLNIDTFCTPPVTIAQCISGTENHPGSANLLTCDDNDYSQAYGQIKEAFTALTKKDIPNPCITDHDLSSSNECNIIGYNS